MSCSPFELKDYFLKELPAAQEREVEAHIKGCPLCREELDRLQLTGAALFSLREEEIPQRIAFVSDKVFEPSPWRRWWSALWGSSARLGFASAAMLSVALLVSAVMRPAPVGRVVTDPPKAAPSVQPVSNAEIQTRIDAAIAKAVTEMESRQARQTAQLVSDLEDARRKLLVAAAEYDLSEKRVATLRASNYELPPLHGGGNK